ncbi:MAG TPA: ROK family protein [Candidatus Saccharimonadales bacterium]|nr:ROK family protein [Candidatus Saccharimonadales bacterium]
MYVGIDIGGTKTLVAALTNEGIIHESLKFPTPPNYDDFLVKLKAVVAKLTTKDFRAGAVAAPGEINRKRGIFKVGGNLKWRNEPIQHDVERIVHCPILLENDANLAGLSEAMLLKDKHAKVLYLTISTGIGGGFIVDQQIDPSMEDVEPGQIMLQRGDKVVKWESFASGKAIYERYHQKASDIEDPAIWKAIVKDLTIGFIDLMAVTQPDVIVVGGGVGHYLHKFHAFLIAELEKYATPLVPIPPIVKAKRPEEAVVYGCYDLARSVHK